MITCLFPHQHTKRIPGTFVRFLSLSLVLLIAFAGSPNVFGQERLTASVVLEREAVMPGSTVGVAIVMELQPLWHVYAGKGSPDEMAGYIATEIALTLPRGWNVGPTQWPKAHEILFGPPEMQERVRVYDGRAIAYIPVTIPNEAVPEEVKIAAKVRYQACDDMICEMPTESSAFAILKVIDVNSSPPPPPPLPTDPARAPVFADYTPPPSLWATLETTLVNVNPVPSRVALALDFERTKLVPGDQVGVAVRLKIQDSWHLQAGEGTGEPADYPTKLTFSLPNGWAVSAVQWPPAVQIPVPGSVDVGSEMRSAYEGNVIAYVGLTLPAELEPGDYNLTATLDYRAGNLNIDEEPSVSNQSATIEVVVPGSSIPLPAIETTELFREFDHSRAFRADAEAFAAAGKDVVAPHKFKFGWKEARWLSIAFLITLAMLFMVGKTFFITKRKGVITATLIGGVLASMGGWTLALSAIRPHGTPFTFTAFEAARARGDLVIVDFTAEWCINCKTVEARVLHHEEFENFVARPEVTFLVADITTGQEEGQKLKDREPRFGGGIPILAIYHPGSDEIIIFQGLYTLAPVMEALQGKAPQVKAGQIFDFLGYRFSVGENAWPIILLLAGIAGFFLNLTPCVLPVIPIKVLSLQAHAKNPARCFFLGVVFASGIVAMFAVLGILMGGVVVGMDKMQWGEFYQHWWVNLIVGIIILVMALGMFDVFTTRLPNWAYLFNPQSDTAKGSFFLGVLTAVLATPCTGPLLGAALVWVATQPAWLALTMFVVMGVGMALPYVILTANPKWIERIPRSGPGSELVKQVMGLLLIAAAAFFLLAVPLNLGNASNTDTTQVGSMPPTPRVAG